MTRNTSRRVVLAVLLLLSDSPRVWGQEDPQLRQHHRRVAAPGVTDTAASGIEHTLAEWWGRNKQALQYLSACGLASASLSYAFIVGIGNPMGGAILGLLGAAIMVAICL